MQRCLQTWLTREQATLGFQTCLRYVGFYNSAQKVAIASCRLLRCSTCSIVSCADISPTTAVAMLPPPAEHVGASFSCRAAAGCWTRSSVATRAWSSIGRHTACTGMTCLVYRQNFCPFGFLRVQVFTAQPKESRVIFPAQGKCKLYLHLPRRPSCFLARSFALRHPTPWA